MNFRADLHCHSTCSDGTVSPEMLLDLACEKQLQGLSITDHDTISAYTPELFLKARSLGIRLGCGVEFSCEQRQSSVHILGYDFDLASVSLRAFCQEHQKRKKMRNRTMVDKLKDRGMTIDWHRLYPDEAATKVVGRPHIAALLVEKGYVRTLAEAFTLYLGERCSCYHRGESFTVEETIKEIHQAGGKAFIAHPHIIEKKSILRDLLAMDFEGIECYYSMTLKQHEVRWLELAQQKKWLISGGSDFHGTFKPHVGLGCSWVDQSAFEKIFHDIR